MADDDAAERMGRIVSYATERFMAQLEFILDDPSGLEPDELRALRLRAADLQLNLDLLIDQLGTPFEAKRLRQKLKEAGR